MFKRSKNILVLGSKSNDKASIYTWYLSNNNYSLYISHLIQIFCTVIPASLSNYFELIAFLCHMSFDIQNIKRSMKFVEMLANCCETKTVYLNIMFPKKICFEFIYILFHIWSILKFFIWPKFSWSINLWNATTSHKKFTSKCETLTNHEIIERV